MESVSKKQRLLATSALFAAAIIWGSSFVTMKNSLDGMKPAYLLAVRFSIAAVFLAVIFAGKWKKFSVAYIFPSALIGLLLAAAYCLQTYGLQYTTPGKNAFLTSVYCILVPFLYWLIRQVRPDLYNFIAAALCVVGIGLVSIETGEGLSMGRGDILTLSCGIFYALHIIVMAIYLKKLEPSLLTALQFAFAAIFLWIFTLIFEGAPTKIEPSMIPDLLFLAIAASAVALLFQNYGIKYCSPSGAAIILSLESVFGVLFSLLAGKEDGFGWQKALGFAIVFAAIIVSETKLSFLKNKSPVKAVPAENSDGEKAEKP